MNNVILSDWYAQPIHCPFCGEALWPSDGASCKHLLYIISAGNFVGREARFDMRLSANDYVDTNWPEFCREEIHKYGQPYDVANRIRQTFTNSVEYEIQGPTDSSYVCFASLDEELCGWGYSHQSPYVG